METTDDKPSPSNQTKTSITTIYIWNMSEDVWPFISSISDESTRKAEIEENASLGDRELFSLAGDDNVLFITSKAVSRQFLEYYTKLFGNKNFRVLVTKFYSGAICDDILRDGEVFDAIVRAGNGSKRLMMIAYSTTFQFLKLVEAVRDRGVSVFTPESPEEEDAWTVNFYGSKSGIRQLSGASSAREPDFKMAEGLICAHIEDAARIAAKRYLKDDGVVLKTNKGHSGAGLLIYRPGDLPKDYSTCEKIILKALGSDAYWQKFPIVIEEYIQVNQSVGGGSPSVEFRIYKSGKIDYLYFCGMRIDKHGIFRGVEISQDVLSPKIATQIVDTGFFIAEQYASNGYRGFFDVDFVAARNGTMYVTESNVRRTGGTYVYTVAEYFLGKDFMYQAHILSNTSYKLPERAPKEFTTILSRLKPVLYSKKSKEGVVIISENMLKMGMLGYIVFGHNQKQALEIEAKMQLLLH